MNVGIDLETAQTASFKGRTIFHHVEDETAFLLGWAQELQALDPRIERIVVLAQEAGGGAFSPVLAWPDPETALTRFAGVIARALETGQAATLQEGEKLMAATPVRIDGAPVALAAVEAKGRAAGLSGKLDLAAGWLAARLWQARAAQAEAAHGDAIVALDILAALADERRLPNAAATLANELVSRFEVSRVTVAMARHPGLRGGRLRLAAVSRAAWFKRKGPLARAFEAAMEEALDQVDTVTIPRAEDAPPMVDIALAEVKSQTKAGFIAAMPLFEGDTAVGALTLEASHPPDAATLDRIAAVAALTGPVLALKRRQQAWLSGRAPDLAEEGVRALFGAHRPSFRLVAVLVIAGLIALFALQTEQQIKAETVIEGAQQMAATAPFQGFIAEAPARAGDTVAAGDLLARLDDRDLLLELERWRSELSQLEQEQRRAIAEADRAEALLLSAQIGQAQAQLDLAAAKLTRTEIRAPVSGLIFSGDHSQRIGAPVEAGELLYEIAPLNDWRLRLMVDERDLALVAPGQVGDLALTAFPDLRLPIAVDRVTQIAGAGGSETAATVNPFQAEARLSDPSALPNELRPGMEGVARIDTGRASLAQVWSRRTRDWISLTWWRWAP